MKKPLKLTPGERWLISRLRRLGAAYSKLRAMTTRPTAQRVLDDAAGSLAGALWLARDDDAVVRANADDAIADFAARVDFIEREPAKALAFALASLHEEVRDRDACDCPTCQARRAADVN